MFFSQQFYKVPSTSFKYQIIHIINLKDASKLFILTGGDKHAIDYLYFRLSYNHPSFFHNTALVFTPHTSGGERAELIIFTIISYCFNIISMIKTLMMLNRRL